MNYRYSKSPLGRKQARQARNRVWRETWKRQRRRVNLFPRGSRSFYGLTKQDRLRDRYLDEVDDPSLALKPLPPRPPRKDKRPPGKPGRR